MRLNGRWVLGFLVILVIGVALWRGGVLLLLGVILFGIGYLLKWFLGWRNYEKHYGTGEETFRDFLGVRFSKRRPTRRPPRDN
jgi:hypothetical protein